MQWGHVFFVPIGYDCLRLRSQWHRDPPGMWRVDPPDNKPGEPVKRRRFDDSDGGIGGMGLVCPNGGSCPIGSCS